MRSTPRWPDLTKPRHVRSKPLSRRWSSWPPSSGEGADEPAHPRGPDHLRRARRPQLSPLLHRSGGLPDWDVDADDRAVVAGAVANPLEYRPWGDRGPPDAARAPARSLWRRDRRPGRQAEDDDRAAERDGRPGVDPRAANRDRRRPGVADRGTGGAAWPKQRVREPEPAVVHARDGRSRVPAQRGQPQLGAGQRRADARSR